MLTTLPQAHATFLNRIRDAVASDDRFRALLIGGSYVHGGLDEHSDLDFDIVVEDNCYADVLSTRKDFAEALPGFLNAFTGEHVGEPRLLICLYGPPLLHIDLKFSLASDLDQQIERRAVLFARDPAEIEKRIEAAAVAWPNRPSEWFEARAWIWLHYAATKLARGELYEAIGMLGFFREQVLGPLLYRRAGKDQRGVRRLETLRLDEEGRLVTTVARHDALSVRDAIKASVDIYLDLRADDPSLNATRKMPELLYDFIEHAVQDTCTITRRRIKEVPWMDLDREQPCAAIPVPASISDELAGYEWARNNVGQSGGSVYRLFGKPGAPDLFLKHGKDAVADDIADEMLRLRWLARYMPVPVVRHFVSRPGDAWLLMTAVPGETAYQVLKASPNAQQAVVDALAAFLRRLHEIPVSECPFNSDHRYRLARARERVDAGLIEEDDFDEERKGWTAEQVWDEMHRLLPLTFDPVVTFGDFSLDNLLMIGGQVVGCIDAGRVGIADRYQDLAILWNCLGEFDPSLQERLLAQYGITDVDQRKLKFHLLLDELF